MTRFTPLMIIFFITAACLVTLAYVVFYGVPQTDKLICQSASGDQFVLTSRFRWAPIRLNPYVDHRTSQENYHVTFIRKNGHRYRLYDNNIAYTQIDAPGSAEGLCAQVGVKNGVPMLYLSYLDKHGHWYDWPGQVPAVLFSYTVKGTKPEVQKLLDSVNGIASDFRQARILPVENRLVYELPVTEKATNDIAAKNQFRIVAVLTSNSTDGGVTWSKLSLNRTPLIFELGKPTWQQSFVARPIYINGEKVIHGGVRRSRGTVNGVRK